jgi:hypothetical protein
MRCQRGSFSTRKTTSQTEMKVKNRNAQSFPHLYSARLQSFDSGMTTKKMLSFSVFIHEATQDAMVQFAGKEND